MCKNNQEYVVLHRSKCGAWTAAPVGCGDPTCIECERYKSHLRQEAWLPVVEAMKKPRLITLTERSLPDLEGAWLQFNDHFRRFMDISLGSKNVKRLRLMADQWLESHHSKLIASGRMTEVKAIEEKERWRKLNDRFFRSVKPKKEDGKPTRLRDLIGEGFASREVTYAEKGWHLHAHLVTDGAFIPHPVLVASWLLATEGKGEIVDIRLLEVETETGRKKSMKEAIKYISKAWTIPEDKIEELRTVVKGKQRIKPLGGAKPLVPEAKPCKCGDPDCKARFLGEGRLIRMDESTMEIEAVLSDNLPGDQPVIEMKAPSGFDGEDNTYRLIFNKVEGEWKLLYLIRYELAPQKGIREAAQNAPPGDRWRYFRNKSEENHKIQAERMAG